MKKIQNMDTALLIYKQDRINQGDLKALAENIKTYGLQHPLLITQKNGKYDIIDGRRRLEACKIAGFNEVPCIVLSKEEANGDLSLILNTHRLNLGPVELYKMAARYVKDELKGDPLALPPEKIKAVAAKLNLDIHATCRILNIGRMDKKVQDLIVAGKLPMKLALLSINIKNQKMINEFCNMCVKDRPTMGEIAEWLADSSDGKTGPCRPLWDADFDNEECSKCRYRGRREKSLFEELGDKYAPDADCCWNPECYNRKTKEVWDQKLAEAKNKLGLSGISKAGVNFLTHDSVEYSKVIPTDRKKCKSCKQVTLASPDEIQPMCPKICANIKETKRSTHAAAKTKKKDPKKFTREEKIAVLNERFALAARKAMLDHFIKTGSQVFAKGRIPKDYRRILFFMGCDAHNNPFSEMTCWDGTFRAGCKEIVAKLDLRKVAKRNLDKAANHLWRYDRSGIKPERIDKAIALLYGIENWCGDHYEDIFAKLSKRSKTFLADIKPWKPAWAGAKKKRKKK